MVFGCLGVRILGCLGVCGMYSHKYSALLSFALSCVFGLLLLIDNKVGV